jgi:predicted HTH transcriptional regulator
VSPGEVSVTFFVDNDSDVKDTVKDTHEDTVNDTQNQILNLIARNPRITAKTISAELGINERNVKKTSRY